MSSLCRSRHPAHLFLSVLASLAAVAAALPGHATTVVRMDDAELVGEATLIVTGECVDSRSGRLGGRIVTLATVRVASLLKGSAPTSSYGDLLVVLPGGVDLSGPVPMAEVWSGAPELIPGEEVLLFLRPFSPLSGSWSIVGYSQGLFTLAPAAAGGTAARRDLSGVRLVESEGEAGSDGLPGGSRSEPLAYWRRLAGEAIAGGEGR